MNVNNEILKIWNTHKDDIIDLLGRIDPSQEMLSPLFYPDMSQHKNTILFIGLNPSYNERLVDNLSENQNLTELLKNWHDLNQDEIEAIIKFDTSVKEPDEKGLKTKYPYFQKFQYIVNSINESKNSTELLKWEHIDLFFYRMTSQSQFKQLIYLDNNQTELNNFARSQLVLSKQLIEIIQPKLIVVANAFASTLFKEEIYKSQIQFEEEKGYHLLELDSNKLKTPVFFTSMLTGQRALDNHSFERLCWHIKKVLED